MEIMLLYLNAFGCGVALTCWVYLTGVMIKGASDPRIFLGSLMGASFSMFGFIMGVLHVVGNFHILP